VGVFLALLIRSCFKNAGEEMDDGMHKISGYANEENEQRQKMEDSLREAQNSPSIELIKLETQLVDTFPGLEYFETKGIVQNITKNRTMTNMEVIVLFYDAEGNQIFTDQGDIEFETLAPGVSSPFEVKTFKAIEALRMIKKVDVEFKSNRE